MVSLVIVKISLAFDEGRENMQNQHIVNKKIAEPIEDLRILCQ